MDDELTSKSTVLHFQSYDQRHLASNIAAEVHNRLHDLGIEDKVTSVTADGATNMANAFSSLDNVDRFWCVAHRLHLTLCNGLCLWKKFKKDEEELNNNNSDLKDSFDAKTTFNENDMEYLQEDDIEKETTD
ncbi:unnamed protein product, partial [Rotaria socialis]